MSNREADTCRKLVVLKLLACGWDTDPHSIAEQRSITDGRIVPVGKGFIRKPVVKSREMYFAIYSHRRGREAGRAVRNPSRRISSI